MGTAGTGKAESSEGESPNGDVVLRQLDEADAEPAEAKDRLRTAQDGLEANLSQDELGLLADRIARNFSEDFQARTMEGQKGISARYVEKLEVRTKGKAPSGLGPN